MSKTRRRKRNIPKYELTPDDYKSILKGYHETIPRILPPMFKTKQVLATKLCRCIRKVNQGPRSIGICTKSIFTQRHLNRGSFRCKGRNRTVNVTKKTKKRIYR